MQPELVWARMAGETGSELVTRTVRIFSEGIRLGGDPAVVGQLAAAFAQKVSLMRQTRSMIAITFQFVVMPMHAALLGILLFVTEVVSIFGGKISEVQDQSLDSDTIQQAGVSQAIVFSGPDMHLVRILVYLMIILLTVADSFAPYAASGGHRYKIFGSAVIMMLISGAAILIVPAMVQALFHNVAATPTGSVPTTPGT